MLNLSWYRNAIKSVSIGVVIVCCEC